MDNYKFDSKLLEIMKTKSMAELLKIPGVYEIMAEEFNNDVILQMSIDDIMGKRLQEKDLSIYPADWPKTLKMHKWRLDKLLGVYKEDTGEDFPWNEQAPEGFNIIDTMVKLVARRSSEELAYNEFCPHCEIEVGASELKGPCILCGKELIVCSMCQRLDMSDIEGSCAGCEHGSRMLLEKEE